MCSHKLVLHIPKTVIISEYFITRKHGYLFIFKMIFIDYLDIDDTINKYYETWQNTLNISLYYYYFYIAYFNFPVNRKLIFTCISSKEILKL